MKQIIVKCNICEVSTDDLEDRLYGVSLDGPCLDFSPVKESAIHICASCLEAVGELWENINTKSDSSLPVMNNHLSAVEKRKGGADDNFIKELIKQSNVSVPDNIAYNFSSEFSQELKYVNQGIINKAVALLFEEKLGISVMIAVVWMSDFSGIEGFVGETPAGEIFGFSCSGLLQGQMMEQLQLELSKKLSSLITIDVNITVKDTWSCEKYIDNNGCIYSIENQKIGFIEGIILPADAILGVTVIA